MIKGFNFRKNYILDNDESIFLLQTGIYHRSIRQYISTKLTYY